MARWRTHNRRADKKRRMPYPRFKLLRKAARFGLMYGMGAQKLFNSFAIAGETARETRRRIETFRLNFERSPLIFEDPGIRAKINDAAAMIGHTGDYFALELRALALHRQQLDEARERGAVVIEHNGHDASVFYAPGVPSKIVDHNP